MFLYFSIFWVIQDEKLKLLIAIIIGSGLGNLLNHFYPPYHVIDFLYSAHLNQWLNMGIFNMADMMLNLMYVAICGYLLYSLITKLLVRSSRQKVA
jgi:lipoprotein signal peptidase